MHESATRKGSPPIKVYCLPEEKAEVQAKAGTAGLSLSTYLLRVGMGYEIHGVLDHRRVDDLARVNADLGRLGGLLKLWLTNDERLSEITPTTLRALLWKIEATQDELRELMKAVVR
jgi:hypothetical protein